MSLYQVERARQVDPARPAVRLGTTVLTYRDLDDRVGKAAGWLRAQGLVAGDVLALQLPRGLELVELHLGALALGVATLPLNEAYTPAEVAVYLEDSQAAHAVLLAETVAALGRGRSATGLRAALDAASPVRLPLSFPPETPALLLYTSGTTGQPKGAMLSQGNIAATLRALHVAWRWSRGDHLLHVLPLFHIHGLIVALHGALYAGATTTLMERFDPETALAMLEKDGCTMFMGVPTHYNRFLALPADRRFDLSAMRLFTSGSAPLPARVHRAFEARFGQVVLERYGMTEVGIMLSNPVEGPRKPGSVGRSVPGARLQIRDPQTGQRVAPGAVGELFHAGPGVVGGYLGRPEASAAAIQDGWLRSGDLGFEDADGYIHLVGRGKDLVISGGLNVYPVEVEAVLLEHPEVAEVAVLGLPDDDFGERVVAAVVPVPGRLPDPADLLAFARQRLAPYKCPKDLRRVAELPRNAMGKVQKAALRAAWLGSPD